MKQNWGVHLEYQTKTAPISDVRIKIVSGFESQELAEKYKEMLSKEYNSFVFRLC